MNQQLWDKAVAFHGHECPGLAIGVRAALAAMEKLGVGRSADEELVCVAENDACGVDGVQAILGCTAGKGNLLFRNVGKQAFAFFDRKSGRALRVCLKARNHGEMDRAQWKSYLLEAPLEAVFSFSEPQYCLPEEARIFKTLECELCGEGAAEPKMRLQDGLQVCADCFKDYSRGF